MYSFHTTPLGWLIRSLPGKQRLPYPDEIEGWTPPSLGEEKTELPESDASSTSDQSRVVPEGTRDEKGFDPDLVDWYGPDDPENPYNWSSGYKAMIAGLIAYLTFSVYIGSAIYTSGLHGANSVSAVFNVSEESALVGLTTFVAGYGVGPMFLSPLTELPRVGRSVVYIITLLLFVLLQLPLMYAKNIQTVLAMRFLTGFFGSPALATGGASMTDLYSPKYAAYALGIWGVAAVTGPALGPLIGGFGWMWRGWTWTIWPLFFISVVSLISLLLFLPETYGENILYRRAVRLRKLTGNQNLRTRGEIHQANQTKGELAKETLWKPFVLLFEPIVFVLNLYISFVYALLYIWFESFPIVFQDIHGMNVGVAGCAFIGVIAGNLIGLVGFVWYGKKYMEPEFDANKAAGKGEELKPERRLIPTCVAAILIPICLFWFGWSGRKDVHWIVPIMASSLYGIGDFLLFQTVFAFLADAYPSDAASVLAGNDLMRSGFGAAFPLFAGAMYHKLGVGWASSLLGFLACVFVPVPFVLIKYGDRIRLHSKRANHDFIELNKVKS